MTNTKLVILATSVALTLAATVSFWIRRADERHPKLRPTFVQTNPVGSSPELPPKSQQDTNIEDIDELPRPPDYSRSDWTKQKEVHRRALSWNGGIEFYAKLVDQHGTPVVGAEVEVKVSGYPKNFLFVVAQGGRPSPQEEQKFTLNSDINGKVSVSGRKGMWLNVQNITRTGYVTGPIETGTFGYGYNAERDAPHTNPATPIVFKLWKQGTAEPFIGRHCEVRLVDSQSNRQEGWVNLVTGEVKPDNNGGPVDLVIRDLAPTSEQRQRRIARVIELEVINGGIQETADVFPYSAPDNGYAPKLILEIDEHSARSFPIRKRNVYVQLRKGRLYAGIITDLWTERIFTLDGYVNPTGSRNLEPDSARQITDEAEIQRLDLETSK